MSALRQPDWDIRLLRLTAIAALTGNNNAPCWVRSMLVRYRISGPRALYACVRRLCAGRAVLARLDALARNMGTWVRRSCFGRQRRSFLLAHSFDEHIDDRRVPRGLGFTWYTPLGTAQRHRVVWILRSPELARWRMVPLHHVAKEIPRFADTDIRRARCSRGTSAVRHHLRFLWMVALCLRRLHRDHGALLATWSVRNYLPHGAWSHCRRNRPYHRDTPASSRYTRSDHGELVQPSGLGTELFYAAPARLGHAASKSMVGVRGDSRVDGRRVASRDFIARPPLGVHRTFAHVNKFSAWLIETPNASLAASISAR